MPAAVGAPTDPFPTSAFDYDLPPDRIAQHPAERRDESRLLVLDRTSGGITHRVFRDIVELIPAGDALVLNETRVFPARFIGRKPTGATGEVLLLRPILHDSERGRSGNVESTTEGTENAEAFVAGRGGGTDRPYPEEPESGELGVDPDSADSGRSRTAEGADSSFGTPPDPETPLRSLCSPWLTNSPPDQPASVFRKTAAETWEALVRPGSKLKPGRVLEIADDLRIEILDSTPEGGRIVRLDTPLPVDEAIRRHGRVPLPPYIQREAVAEDVDRYQIGRAHV